MRIGLTSRRRWLRPSISLLQLSRDFLKLAHVSVENIEGTRNAVMLDTSALVHFQAARTALNSVMSVVLAVVSFLGVVNLHPADYRFRSRH